MKKKEVKSYNAIVEHIDIEGYPVLSPEKWSRLRENIDPLTLKYMFVDYFTENQIPYPFPAKGQKHAFDSLDYIEKLNFTKEFTWNTEDYPNTVERVNNKHPYKSKPLMLMKFNQNHNIASNYFQRENRIQCAIKGKKSAYEQWNDPKELFKCIRYIFSESNLQRCDINKRMYADMMRRCSSTQTTQSPIMSKLIYSICKSKVILDIFPEWGDRLCGFYTSLHSKEYYCFEVNQDIINAYKRQVISYENWIGGEDPNYFENEQYIEFDGIKKVRIYKSYPHLFDFDKLDKKFDIMFTENIKWHYKNFSKSNTDSKLYMNYPQIMKNVIFNAYHRIQNFVDFIVLDVHNYDKMFTHGDVANRAEDDTIDYLGELGYTWLGKAGVETPKNAQFVKMYPELNGVENLKFIKPISFFHKDANFDICQNNVYRNFNSSY